MERLTAPAPRTLCNKPRQNLVAQNHVALLTNPHRRPIGGSLLYLGSCQLDTLASSHLMVSETDSLPCGLGLPTARRLGARAGAGEWRVEAATLSPLNLDTTELPFCHALFPGSEVLSLAHLPG